MILGAAAWGLRETALKEQLEMVKRIGLSALEAAIDVHEDGKLSFAGNFYSVKAVKDMFAEHGVSLIAAAVGNDFTQADPESCKGDLQKMERSLDVAGELGVSHLRIFAGFSPAADVTGSRWDTMIDCLVKAGEYAKTCNVQLAVETHGGVEEVDGGVRHFFSTSSQPDLLDKMLLELPEDIGMVFDPANLGAVGLSTSEIIELYHKYQSRICYFHLKDFRKITDTAVLPCACGEGQLDWSDLSEAFSGFPGYGFIEYEMPEDVEDGMLRSLKVLQ